MKLSIKKGAALVGVLTAVAAPSAFAQGITADQLGLSSAQLQALLGTQAGRATPGISIGSPTGFGASWGTIGFGIGGATLPSGGDQDLDGSAGVVVGFGDAQKAVGLEVVGNIISITEDFGHDGNFAAKLHTSLPGGAAFAVGIENIGRWGRAKTTESTVYAAASKVMSVSGLTVALNGGIGDNRFNDAGDDGVSPFGSVAVFPIRQMSVIADWAGNALNAGISLAPVDAIPVTITLGVANLTERNGGDAEFAGGIGYTYTFQ